MKNKIIKNFVKELELTDSFFDGEINQITEILSKILDKYIKYETITRIEFIKKFIKGEFYINRKKELK